MSSFDPVWLMGKMYDQAQRIDNLEAQVKQLSEQLLVLSKIKQMEYQKEKSECTDDFCPIPANATD